MRFGKIIRLVKDKIKKERNKLIIEEYKKGMSEDEIAKMFNVNKSTIHLVIRNFLEKSRKIAG